MDLAAFGTDNSLVVFGHLLQKSGKGCSTILAENVYFFFRRAHHASSISLFCSPLPAQSSLERNFTDHVAGKCAAGLCQTLEYS
jgi:hypothetical protein